MSIKSIYLALLAVCIFVTCSFNSCTVEPQAPGVAGGFPVTTYSVTQDSDGNVIATGVMPGTQVSGNWVSDTNLTVGSVESFGINQPFYTDDNGNGYVNNGKDWADWTSTVGWPSPACPGFGINTAPFYVTPTNWIGWTCVFTQDIQGDNTSTHFVLPGAVPPTIASYGAFSTTYGDPQLRVYTGGTTPGFVSGVSASSVVPGSSATFPFPTQSNGSPLAEGFYGLVNTNVASGGGLAFVNPSYLAVGGSTTVSGVFGVDAADVTFTVTILCNQGPPGAQVACKPTITNTVASEPLLTEYYAGQVSYLGHTLPVGSYPVAVKSYGRARVIDYNDGSETESHTGPASVIVVNSGSNNVTVLNLANYTTAATISVGTQPMAVVLNSGATYAYVANYGSGTLSEVNLSTNAVTRTASGATGALAVAVDPGGSYVWVGGTNYLYKVSLSSFAVVASYPVTGSVTSLAASNTQNELIYTLVHNCCTGSSTYATNEVSLADMSTKGTYANATASPYAAYTMNGTLPNAAVLPQASTVSAQFSNGIGASATPTGFVIYDLIGHQQIMTGTTPTPVRGIAADPNSTFAYFTLPDSNEYIAVPLESQ